MIPATVRLECSAPGCGTSERVRLMSLVSFRFEEFNLPEGWDTKYISGEQYLTCPLHRVQERMTAEIVERNP